MDHQLTEQEIENYFKLFLLEAGENTLKASKLTLMLIAIKAKWVAKPDVYRTPANGRVVITYFLDKPYIVAMKGEFV